MTTSPLGNRFLAAVIDQDNAALAATMADDVVLRAVLPRREIDLAGADDATSMISSWFADATQIDVCEQSVGMVGARVAVRYLLRVVENGTPYTVEQCVYGSPTGDGERFARVDLVCSGFHPVQTGERHQFDAGPRGCADGLAGAVREAVAAIPVGDQLAVVVSDPAAVSDLPPLARLMGHTVVETRALKGGRTEITLERGR